MIAYVYQAAFICDDCADEIMARQQRKSEKCQHGYADQCEDSGCRPQYAGTNGGGESDTPQHCDLCGLFLKNPLTRDGYCNVQTMIADNLLEGKAAPAITLWLPFYFTVSEQDQLRQYQRA